MPTADVDFGRIRNDYEFFLSHSTETAAQLKALKPQMTWLAERGVPARILDFGCGTGLFTEGLLKSSPPEARDLKIWLVEPVAEHLAEAAVRLSTLAGDVIPSGADLEDVDQQHFDLILANHSLYYVPDPDQAIVSLAGLMGPGYRLVAALLDRENAMAKIWQAGFAAMRKPFPFALAEDIERLLLAQGLEVAPERVSYSISFRDGAETRLRILRFLFAAHLDGLPRDEALSLFDAHAHDGRIEIETSYPHLVAVGR